MKNKFKLLILFVVFSCAMSMTFAQQKITRFGVIDTNKVYQTFYRDSPAVRNYEKKKQDFQAQIDRQTQELENMQIKKSEYLSNGNDAMANKLEGDIQKKARTLTEYTKAKNIELENLRKKLESGDDFYELLYDTINRVAEEKGFSLILSLKQASGILWYSDSVDITDLVISEISAKQ